MTTMWGSLAGAPSVFHMKAQPLSLGVASSLSIIMENESEGLQSALSGHDPFEEWVRHNAAAVGLPEAEFREQVLGAYWVVNELVEMNSSLLSNENSLGEEVPIAPSQETPEITSDPVDPAPGLQESLHDLRSQIEELQSALADLEAEPTRSNEPGPHRLEQRLDELEAEIETAASAAELAGHVSMLYNRYADVDEDLEALAGEYRENHDGLAEDYHRHRERVTEELATARTLFEHLLGATNEHTDRLDRIDRVLERRATRQRELAELTERAARLGIGSAECGGCDATINIALLTSPACPSCRREFHGVESTVRWFGLGRDRHTLTVDESSAPRRPSSDSK